MTGSPRAWKQRSREPTWKGLPLALLHRDLRGGNKIMIHLYTAADCLEAPEQLLPTRTRLRSPGSRQPRRSCQAATMFVPSIMGNYRSGDNFLGSDCLARRLRQRPHRRTRTNGSTPAQTLLAAFPGVAFAVHYSRYHMIAREERQSPLVPSSMCCLRH